jgi:hypothetical protein
METFFGESLYPSSNPPSGEVVRQGELQPCTEVPNVAIDAIPAPLAVFSQAFSIGSLWPDRCGPGAVHQ